MLFLLPILTACDQFLEVPLPGQEPRIVLNGLMEPDKPFKLYVSKSQGILEGNFNVEFEPIRNASATVILEDGTQYALSFREEQQDFYETETYYYLDGLDIAEGQSYELKVESPGFPDVSSSQQIPEHVPITDISYRILGNDGMNSTESVVEFSIKFDDPEAKNFYHLEGDYFGRIGGSGNSYSGQLYMDPLNPAYRFDFWYNSGLIFDDVLFSESGAEIVFRESFPKGYDWEVTIELSHVTEDYFEYNRTASLQSYNRGDALSQPVLVHNNVENGLGIFMALSRSRNTIRFSLEE